ncbi:MAG: phosphodiester glycosidase family protein [Oscillospiraceae bacterium]|nr:phosphodiester glycosidase family protein [Oscillospiraceae bacterium]
MDRKEQRKEPFGRRLARFFGRTLLVLLVTLLIVCMTALGAIFILCKGPSETARDRFVRSVKETSAIGFLAEIFLSEEEVQAIMAPPAEELQTQTDASLVAVSVPAETDGPYTDAWGYVDEDGDGIIIAPVKGGSYAGYMMIVLDPSRVVLGCSPEMLGSRGYTVQEFVEAVDGVAGINGGGFSDPGGMGNGSDPDSLIVSRGQIYCDWKGIGHGLVGIDSDYILHVGFRSPQDVVDWDIQEACGYGPVLVINGEMAPEETLISGLNPRTAIGQRSDGAILMLVIEGRQPSRLGATYQDEAEVMMSFGAVNACNLDGGSSSLMWFDGEYINNSASVIGIRPIPTSFVVLKEGRAGND